MIIKKKEVESSSESERRVSKVSKSLLLKSKSKYMEESDQDFKKVVESSDSYSERSEIE